MLVQKKTVGSCAFLGGLPAILTEFAWSWSQMVDFNREWLLKPNERIKYMKSDVSFHQAARNGLAEDMRGEWLFMLDTDHTFSPDILARMLRIMNQYDCEVLSGLYQYKVYPYTPVAHLWSEEAQAFLLIAKYPDTEVFPVDGGGAGCLLVRRTVFERIWLELHEQPFECLPMKNDPMNKNFGEDMSFFLRCKKLGIPVMYAPGIRANHLRTAPVTMEDYKLDDLPRRKYVPST